MKASDLFIKALESEGVEYVFGIPGEENLDLLNSLKDSSIQLILTRHEQAAGFMAATYGRLTGKAGVCMATLGPGATNFVTPAAYAQLGGFPLIMITGQKPIKKSKQGRFQIVDIVRLMEPVAKMSRQIVHGNSIPTLVREAFRIAEEERPGAVLLELPEDIAAEETDAPLVEPHARHYAVAGDEVIEEAAQLIKEAKYPLLLIGAGANRKATSEALNEFVASTNIRFFNTQMGKGVLDERSECFMGTAALSDHDYLHCAIDRSDLVINVGHDVVEKPPFFMVKGGKKVIHVNYRSAQVDEVYFPHVEVVGDISASIIRLKEAVGVLQSEPTYFNTVRNEIKNHLCDGSDDPGFPGHFLQRLVILTVIAGKLFGRPDKSHLGLFEGFQRLFPA